MGSALGIFSAFGLSASAGLNAYIPLLVIALTARFTNLINLNSPWDALASWWIIGLLVVLSLVEFLVDKFPVVNHINDIFVQSVVRRRPPGRSPSPPAPTLSAMCTRSWPSRWASWWRAASTWSRAPRCARRSAP